MWVIHAVKENDSRRMVRHTKDDARRCIDYAQKRGLKVRIQKFTMDVLACNEEGCFVMVRQNVEYSEALHFQKHWNSKERDSAVLLWPSELPLPLSWNWSDDENVGKINESKKKRLERIQSFEVSVEQQTIE